MGASLLGNGLEARARAGPLDSGSALRPHRRLPAASDTWENAAGVVGLILGALALYAAYAAEYEDVLKRPLLTLGRRGKGELAVKGTYSQQIAEVAHEPGVRQQL